MEEVGGENLRRSLAVWNWRIREVLLEITLPSVCLHLLSLSLVSPTALAMDSELLSFGPDTILPTKSLQNVLSWPGFVPPSPSLLLASR